MKEERELIPRHPKLYRIIFHADSPAGKAFDLGLILAIVLSLLVLMLESVDSLRADYRASLVNLEWFFTILFSLEYALRIAVVKRPHRYIFSFYGLVDLISILPTYLALFIGGAQFFMVFRSLRLLRIFRVLKLIRFVGEANSLNRALLAARHKILVFTITVICITFITGTLMYLVEGPENGFTSIPTAVYWSIVTLTTVGYGDISPQSPLGQFLASLIMIMGYGIIAVPTGIVTAELARQPREESLPKPEAKDLCAHCNSPYAAGAQYCHHCGKARG